MIVTPASPLSRYCHAMLGLLAVAGLVINYRVTIEGHPGALFSRTVAYFSFFTILTNLLVAIVSVGMARGRRWAGRPKLRAAISVYILVVALIFQVMLSGLIRFTPLGWWGDLLAHRLVPLGWLACWVMFRPHGHIDRAAPLHWLIFPGLYGLWTLVHGAASGFYPYPFVDVAQVGWLAVARNMGIVALLFLGLGYIARWLDSGLAR